jgi:hypothetical protein
MKKQKFHRDPDLWRVAGILSLRRRNINKRCGKTAMLLRRNEKVTIVVASNQKSSRFSPILGS